jgi:hypothetical protein
MSLPELQSSDEQGFEINDKAINLIDEITSRPENWLGLTNIRLADGYIKSEMGIVLRATFAGEEWLIHFNRLPKSGSGKPRYGDVNVLGSGAAQGKSTREINSDVADLHQRGEQLMVLVGNVQFVEYPEIVALPVLVRFGAPNLILSSLRHSVYLSSKRGFVNLGGLKNREAGLVGNGAAANFNELKSEMIQSTSKIVNGIAKDNADLVGNGFVLSHEVEIESLIPRLRVWLAVNDIGFTLDEPIPDDFQITEVLLGPLDFNLNQGESFFSGHLASIREQV